MYVFALALICLRSFSDRLTLYIVVPVTLFRNCAVVCDHPRIAAEKIGNKNKRNVALWVFGTWLGMMRITWGKSPEWLYRNLCFSKRATVEVRATYATRWNSGMKRVKCGWTQPLFHKVSNHWFSGRNLKG